MIGISNLQSEIYRFFRFPIRATIPNGLEECTCETSTIIREPNSILFVGRLIGKGFERLLDSVAKEGFTVYLAGGHELEKVASSHGKDLNYVFLGKLSRNEVFQTLHKVEFTYVASECFDVYPTIGIEAIRHGSIPITSETTGIRDLVRQIHPSLVFGRAPRLIPLRDLRAGIISGNFDLSSAELQIQNTPEVVKQYLEITQTY